jgi:hypothetical protein|tara:strand:- start:2341 stop:2667 length:327 start_codon:yes stop_codon:yes gene_type:complete
MADACTKKIKRQYKKWPSARASQAVAKCRKAKGQVRKTEKGKSLKRWEKEKWKTKAGKPCGAKGAGGSKKPCRPTKRVSSKTPSMKFTKAAERAKKAGRRAPAQRRRK